MLQGGNLRYYNSVQHHKEAYIQRYSALIKIPLTDSNSFR